MKFWKQTLISAFAFFSIASTVLYSACTDDACTRLRCRNGATCTDDYCHCPSGYEGSQCETQVSQKFLGRYYGNTKCSGTPEIIDSAYVTYNGPSEVKVLKYSTNETYMGVVNGNSINFYGTNGKIVNLKVENSRINLYIAGSGEGTDTTVCSFIGTTK